MRAARRRAGGWLLGLLALVASPAVATTTPPLAEPPSALIGQLSVEALEAELARDMASATSPAQATDATPPSFSLRPTAIASYRELFAPGEDGSLPPLPRFDIEPHLAGDLLSLPETRIRASRLLGAISPPCPNRLSRENATGSGLGLAANCDQPFASFLSEDPFEGRADTPPSLHRYVYGYANPTIFVDPTGEAAVEIGGRQVWVPDILVDRSIEKLGEGVGYIDEASRRVQGIHRLLSDPPATLSSAANRLVRMGPELAHRMVRAAREDGLTDYCGSVKRFRSNWPKCFRARASPWRRRARQSPVVSAGI